MIRTYYKYDPNQCGFVPVVYTFPNAAKRFLTFFGYCLLSSVIILSVIVLKFPEVLEDHLIRENNNHKNFWLTLKTEVLDLQNRMDRLENQDDEHFRIVLNMEKLSPEVRAAGIGGHKEFDLGGADQVKEIHDTYLRLSNLKSKSRLQKQSFEELYRSLEETEIMLASRPAIQPIDNRQLTRFHPLFGMRFHPIFGDWRLHKGLDLTAPMGTPVYATGDGLVTMAEFRGGYGNVVFINHGYGFETRYAHLSKFKVFNGKKVKRGEIIGYVGNTGTSTNAHLHYEVLYENEWINPIHFMYRDLKQVHFNEIIKAARK